MAGQLMAAFPAWLVLWSTYTREFWAFPSFAAQPETVLPETDPSVLAGVLRADVWQTMPPARPCRPGPACASSDARCATTNDSRPPCSRSGTGYWSPSSADRTI